MLPMRCPCLSLFAALLLCACHKEPERRVPFDLGLAPGVEVGGYLAAHVNGFFRDAHLSVKFARSGKGETAIENVASGSALFGVAAADQLLIAQSRGVPVVAVFAPIQISPDGVLVRESSPVTNLADLKGVTLTASLRSPAMLYLRNQVVGSNQPTAPYTGSLLAYLLETNCIIQANAFRDPDAAQQKGQPGRMILAADAGFNPYHAVLFTSAATLRDRPQLVAAFVRASLRGWQRYLADPEQTHKFIIRENSGATFSALIAGHTRLKKCVLSPLGNMTLERWTALANQLAELGFIAPNSVDPNRAFTTQFLSF